MNKPPLPVVQAYLLCREIFQAENTGEHIIVGPFSRVTLPRGVQRLRFSVYAQLTDAEGEYQLELQARDGDDVMIWNLELPEPLFHDDRLTPHKIALHNLTIELPVPGKYDVVLLANDELLANHSLTAYPAQT